MAAVNEEVETEITTLISSTGGESEAAMKQALSTENAKESIRSTLMNRKIMARLVEITQGGESASPASTATAEPEETEETEETEEPVDTTESETEQETGPEEESPPAEEATE